MIAIIGGSKAKRPEGIERIGGKREESSYEGGGDMEEDEPVSSEEARMEAARGLIRAVKMGDAAAVDEALEAHWTACGK